jgi:hypothetical protein
MSTRDFTILKCDMRGCDELFRLPIDSDCVTDNRQHVRAHAAGEGWHTYSVQGLAWYTADYCPKHPKATSEGIRGAKFPSRRPPCEFDIRDGES